MHSCTAPCHTQFVNDIVELVKGSQPNVADGWTTEAALHSWLELMMWEGVLSLDSHIRESGSFTQKNRRQPNAAGTGVMTNAAAMMQGELPIARGCDRARASAMKQSSHTPAP